MSGSGPRRRCATPCRPSSLGGVKDLRADGANLLRFLKNADQLVVPLYQRRYSWTEDEWRQLWADILRVADDPAGPDHFIGSVVQIGGIALSAGHNPLQLIDGQQRITTISLVLLALARRAQG